MMELKQRYPSGCRPMHLSSRTTVRMLVVLAAAMVVGGCASSVDDPSAIGAAGEGYAEVDELHIVDCLLPGQVRKLGNKTYVTPRRPTRTTAKDCNIRGGEYVAYDRADYRSALKVWLQRAQEGDPEAQNYVGEIFEKGLGREPDYVSAAEWYRKAAEQGYARAQINLGFLYEQGLGVEEDIATALNWYRQASGLEQDELVYRSEYSEKIQKLRDELTTELSRAQDQVDALENQLQQLRQERNRLREELEASQQAEAEPAPDGEVEIGEIRVSGPEGERLAQELEQARERISTLEGLFAQVRDERESLETKLAQLPKQRSIAPQEPESEQLKLPDRAAATLDGIRFGRYYALIVGNQDYQYLEDLDSPINDARRVREILEDKYGFSTIFLPNANEGQILNALNDLYEQIGPEDNLLVYYAGHGSLSEQERRQRGYWLPINARQDRLVHWINNAVISDHLDRIRARSVLVLADSCYAGALASESSALLLPSTQSNLSAEDIRNGLNNRARIVISSGGVKPVLDRVDRKHSLFAGSLIDVLSRNEGVLRENMLFAHVAATVRRRSEDLSLPQTPEMRPIRAAGHSGGDFYFVPVEGENL
ncbi:caspase family protein [Ectothiorhodospiraceae bacterium WFHF3C12]|nr:caspase family protein [Ectothiorhodospiraceae bacterium WFHF3C12]